MATLVQDVRHAARALAKHPGSLVMALLTLALGIGFSTATFSVINAVLLRPQPYHDPGRLVVLRERSPQYPQFSVSPGHYLFWRDHNTAFEGIGAYDPASVNFDPGAQPPERVRADRVTANLFPLLGLGPILGRNFQDRDDHEGAPRVILLSFGAWHRRFGGAREVLGKAVRVDGQPATIVGVMPAGLAFPSAETEMWMPMAFSASEGGRYGSHYLSAIGRLKPGATLESADADMKVVSRRLVETVNPGSRGWDVLLFDLQEYTVQGVRRMLYLLLGAVSLVLVIACVNVANLLLVRGAARHRELAIRSAIGATRGRLLRQLVVEQLSLALVSATAGVLVAAWLLRVLLALMPDALPRQLEIRIDGQVLAFALALAALTPFLFGLLPAIYASRPDLRALLAAGGRQMSGAPARRLRTALVIVEIAFAMMLLVGAGLLIRSFSNLLDEPPGFRPDHVVVAGLSLPVDHYPQGAPRERLLAEFVGRVRALPQVAAAAIAMPMPMVNDFNTGFEIEGTPLPRDQRPVTLFYAISDGYFDAIGTPLVRGRVITAADRLGAPRVVVINQTIADRFFPGVDPIGRRLRTGQGSPDWREIVGIVGDVKQTGLADRPRAQIYESYLQHPYFAGFSVVVRTAGVDPATVVPGMRAALRSLDAELPLARVQTLDAMVEATVRPQRFSTTLIGLFGAAAVLLAAVGVYGVTAYSVGLRRQEFAIRIAHGAGRGDILRLVMRGAVKVSAGGIAAGLIGAWLLRRAIEQLLFGVTAGDAVTYLSVATILALVAMAASAIPALRATRVSPIAALRGD